ncbi:alpha/beta fold hydrolase [Acinetobacter sp. YH12027]|uniref:alpha/beta fold hydrolase n=1 Tax=Acinetobacter sp. YH12027 TaxID=2601043 RepID=UPI0035A010E0
MNIQEHSEFIKLNAYELYTKAWQPETTDKDATLAPIILMHDSLGSVDLWRDFPAQLAAESCRTVIAYDRLGFGRSSANPHLLSTDFVYAEARQGFKALLQHYSIQQFIVMGHSVGGGMSVVIATEYQEQCHGLITIAAQYEVEELTLSGIREAKTGFAQPGTA